MFAAFKEFSSKIGFGSHSNALGANFRKFGPSFGAYEYDDYIRLAQKFFHEGIDSDDALYSVKRYADGRIAIDYNGEIRGVYTRAGKPLAFFRPDFRQLGYPNKSQELQAFRSGHNELLAS